MAPALVRQRDPEIPNPEIPDPEIPNPEIPKIPNPEVPDPEIPSLKILDPKIPPASQMSRKTAGKATAIKPGTIGR